MTGVAIGWAGQSEGRIELCVIAAATLCHEMVQFVMYLALLTLAFNGERLVLESDSFYYPRKTREWSSRGVSLVTAASSRDSYTPEASRFDAPPGVWQRGVRGKQTQPPLGDRLPVATTRRRTRNRSCWIPGVVRNGKCRQRPSRLTVRRLVRCLE